MQLTFKKFIEHVPKDSIIVATTAFTGERCFKTHKHFIPRDSTYESYIVWNIFIFYNEKLNKIEFHISLLKNIELSEEQEGGDYE